MKKFKFNLEAPLRLYNIEEDKKKRLLADANRNQEIAIEEYGKLNNEYDDAQDSEAKLRLEGVSIGKLRLFTQYIFDLKKRIVKQSRVVQETTVMVEKAVNELVEATRKVKAVNNIKDKKMKEWKKERNKFEAKFIDDICQQKYIQTQKTG